MSGEREAFWKMKLNLKSQNVQKFQNVPINWKNKLKTVINYTCTLLHHTARCYFSPLNNVSSITFLVDWTNYQKSCPFPTDSNSPINAPVSLWTSDTFTSISGILLLASPINVFFLVSPFQIFLSWNTFFALLSHYFFNVRWVPMAQH